MNRKKITERDDKADKRKEKAMKRKTVEKIG